MATTDSTRKSFADIYVNEQTKILRAQQSMVQTAISIVQILKWPEKNTVAQRISFVEKVLESQQSFMDAIKLRKYVKRLIDLATDQQEDSAESEDEEAVDE